MPQLRTAEANPMAARTASPLAPHYRLDEGLDDQAKARVRSTKKRDLILFHHGWGTGCRRDMPAGG
jgi:hypothetical protein